MTFIAPCYYSGYVLVPLTLGTPGCQQVWQRCPSCSTGGPINWQHVTCVLVQMCLTRYVENLQFSTLASERWKSLVPFWWAESPLNLHPSDMKSDQAVENTRITTGQPTPVALTARLSQTGHSALHCNWHTGGKQGERRSVLAGAQKDLWLSWRNQGVAWRQ